MRMQGLESRPPSRGSRFAVGRDAEGNWVVCDREGLVGGLFADRESAVHFAMVESDRIPGAVCCVPDTEILKLGSVFDMPQPLRRRRAIRHH